MTTATESALPHVNDVALTAPTESVDVQALRQRACTELLRQAAIEAGLLAADDPVPVGGAISEAAASAIELLIERMVQVPQPTDEACQRHHAAHAARYRVGERVHARHILFAVTPGVDVNALRQRAEACLLDVRNRTPEEQAAGDRFAVVAASTSNCPSGAQGGDLGWLTSEECAPEFAREIFGKAEVGVLPRLVHSRFGLHVVEILSREPGHDQPYAAVRQAVAQSLWHASFATALSQYVQVLAGRARVHGIALDGAATPLVQ
ncbi:Chaperone SurA [Cupriavidus laharis]|uniref:peptidylprolyl isomerase n=1 Tax=Cupriavidus laharis TaxID=151654 RepID=A0ABM8XPI4_9BURK|nr:peptidylprolyl isomerase [Cupriavidus laharis]CAG9182194.1 Chaperone SurA [Cupriavidus laharis]